MKRHALLALLLVLLVQAAHAAAPVSWSEWLAQHTRPVAESGDNDADLAPFGAAIKDAQVVLLDEQSHGEETVFALKSRLVKYLHQRHGFEVLVFESGLYDVDRIWRTADGTNTIRTQAPGNLFYLYAGSPSIQHLLDYVQSQKSGAHPLLLSGMDSQHTGQYSGRFLASDLKAYLAQAGSPLPDDAFWPTFVSLSEKLFAMNRAAPDQAMQKRYFAFVEKLKAVLAPERHYFWRRIVLSVENQARRYWGIINELDRSETMGENLMTLIRHRFPGKKVIVWGYYGHLNRVGLQRYGNVGKVIAREFGNKAYVVHFTGNRGRYYNFINDRITPVIRLPGNMIENLLEKHGGPYNFTDWRKLPEHLKQDQAMQAAVSFYFPVDYALWQSELDGTFYLDTIDTPGPK